MGHGNFKTKSKRRGSSDNRGQKLAAVRRLGSIGFEPLDQIFQVSAFSVLTRAEIEVNFALTKRGFDLKNFI
jgi:hypothetical protein